MTRTPDRDDTTPTERTESESDGLDTLVIGIDAGCRPVFERLFEENRIPTIERLCTEGVTAPLESQIPPWTPSAWPSIYTGVNPGKHGVVGFVGYDGYDWHVTSNDDVRAHPLWTLLDRHDRSSVVVNAPVTHPPDEFDGAVIPGFLGPEDPPCHPDGLLDEVRDEIGEYRVYPDYTRGDDSLSDDEKIAEYRNLIRMRGDAFRYLVDEFEPDLGFLQFQKTDTVFHEFAGDEELVNRVYEATDDQLGAVLEACDPDRVFLVSDHGMGPYDGYEFRINEFLRDEGYLETTTGGKGMPSWTPMRRRLREGEECESWEPGATARAASVAARFGITASRIRAALERVGLADLAREYAPSGVSRTANEQVDFVNSAAYVRARTELGVRINLEGRDPNGVVPPEEYEAFREELMRKLQAVETPDGEALFETVAPRERYFHGDYADDTVDIVTIPNGFDHMISEQLRNGEYFGPAEPWNHKLDGIFVAAGEGIDEAGSLERVHIFDVAPTVLSSMGVPYSDRMDGSVAPVVDATEPTSYAIYEDDGADPDRAEPDGDVTDRLADLGYLN
ncbi:type I phosphodiesterase/nucleotide pyrophosphatase [Haloterrigena turkmenica DSM 5511]|uniref:Type I phosphodiesterase/nucleotide pyrophosphatase n=1 Tax=Haloterrigena turkmenica (strain ATCC 51198 / DSM 5511 / JCM 9101 / NCIMB 13204 / VKM B-1734 / 4k) TaxID=543526 RepID=D2RZ93_HALTV|nr:alkaline phosphatase family protein [Haloterrigena turkmenica]ADB60017.1 type I phosphodiesterase/nucleotide pyrophosphatase [Haloterrigena turkmenica DSM 5511]